jgi:hypothetical protein
MALEEHRGIERNRCAQEYGTDVGMGELFKDHDPAARQQRPVERKTAAPIPHTQRNGTEQDAGVFMHVRAHTDTQEQTSKHMCVDARNVL